MCRKPPIRLAVEKPPIRLAVENLGFRFAQDVILVKQAPHEYQSIKGNQASPLCEKM